MGIIKAGFTSADELLNDQWKEFFYCNALQDETMIIRAYRKQTERGGNNESSQDIISDGSVIDVADGQSAVVTENGKVIAVYSEPGENVFETGRVPSIFNKNTRGGFFRSFMERVSFGGDLPVVQRVYYINTREIPANPFAVSGVPFRMSDPKAGIDFDGSISCQGVFSFRVTDAGKFYKVAHINAKGETSKTSLCRVMQEEIASAFHESIGKLAENGLRPSQLPLHTMELRDALNQSLPWAEERGISVVSIGISSLTVLDSHQQAVREMQKEMRLDSPERMGAMIGTAQAEAMQTAAANPDGGARIVSAAPAPQPAPPQADTPWICTCGQKNRGRFCSECGSPRPEEWICTCGHKNKGRFCTECGRKRKN